MALATSLAAQPQTPATQPVRPPDRPPGEPAPLPKAEPPFGSPRQGSGDGERTPEVGDPKAGTLTLKGCVQRPSAKAFRLRHVEGNDATVSEDVRLGGDDEQLIATRRTDRGSAGQLRTGNAGHHAGLVPRRAWSAR